MIPLALKILLLLCFHMFHFIVIKCGRETMPEGMMGTQISTHWRAQLKGLSHHVIFEPGRVQCTKQRTRSVVKPSQHQSGSQSTLRVEKVFLLSLWLFMAFPFKQKHPNLSTEQKQYWALWVDSSNFIRLWGRLLFSVIRMI